MTGFASCGIRIMPALWTPKGGEPVAVVRFIDPADGSEFFMISVEHGEAMIASIRASMKVAGECAETVSGYDPEAKALLVAPTEGRA